MAKQTHIDMPKVYEAFVCDSEGLMDGFGLGGTAEFYILKEVE